jgi:filamentous hemagglutinin
MAQLTSDIVWLVEQTVTLPDGTTTRVLVPQLYARVQPGDLDGSGVLLAGKDIKIDLTGDLTNRSTIAGGVASAAGRKLVSLTAQNVQNLGRITGEAVSVAARADLNNIGGRIDAASALTATAGRDLNITSTTTSAVNQVGNNTYSWSGLDRIAGLYVTNPGGSLLASAGREANITAGILQSQGSLAVSAGYDVNLSTVKTASSSAQVRGANDFLKDSQGSDIGSQLSSKGALSLTAGHDLNAKAASVNATLWSLRPGTTSACWPGKAVKSPTTTINLSGRSR